MSKEIEIKIDAGTLKGILTIPKGATALVIFAHGSGSGRLSPRNQWVAKALNDEGLATLLFDLLTPAEEASDAQTGALRFDIPFLAKRLLTVTTWTESNPDTKELTIGYFGASTGAAAALIAAAMKPHLVDAIVSRGGRPDLAISYLAKVEAPTLLIVGGEDGPVIGMNQTAFDNLGCEKKLEIIPGATHLFEEHGALEQVANMAKKWFIAHLTNQ
jgi:putative phosphoribosyl transferase